MVNATHRACATWSAPTETKHQESPKGKPTAGPEAGAPATDRLSGNPPGQEKSSQSTEDKQKKTSWQLYRNTWIPGRLLSPMVAEDKWNPEECHWIRQLATYTFDHLLAENYRNCTLRQILRA